MLRKIGATYIFPMNRPPIKNGIVVCTPEGEIVDIIDRKGDLSEEHGLEFYSGIITPGFVNAHSHLELSDLHGKIPRNTGLAGFLGEIHKLRDFQNLDQEQERIIRAADKKMWAEGIAAVGDISNTPKSLNIKKSSKIYYHNFIEAFGLLPSRAEKAFRIASDTLEEFQKNGLEGSITPHAAYSVSDDLFRLISDEARQYKSILSIHHQESDEENLFVSMSSGPLARHFQKNIQLEIPEPAFQFDDSTDRILNSLPLENKLIFVHNTFLNQARIKKIQNFRDPELTHFCVCPSANLYIEDRLPPVDLMVQNGLNICLGTDSLASNHRLSIVNEMYQLQNHFPAHNLELILSWATINGAKALGIENNFGNLAIGKSPGINLITGLDLKNLTLQPNSKVKRLL